MVLCHFKGGLYLQVLSQSWNYLCILGPMIYAHWVCTLLPRQSLLKITSKGKNIQGCLRISNPFLICVHHCYKHKNCARSHISSHHLFLIINYMLNRKNTNQEALVWNHLYQVVLYLIQVQQSILSEK